MSEVQTAWQRILTNVVAPVLAAAILGMCAMLIDLSSSMAVVQSQIADMRAEREVQYTAAEAEQRHKEIFRTDKDQYNRLDDHENRIRKLELR